MSLRVVVAGAGMAGSLAAVLLSDAGADVLVVDPSPPQVAAPDEAWSAPRSGCPQLHHTHNFLGELWAVLRSRAPDIVDAVLHAGATSTAPDAALRLRRTTLRTVLADALLRRGVEVARAHVREVDESSHGVRAVTSRGDVQADLVVDATGRRSGLAALEVESDSPAGIVYLSRHYRAASGIAPPASSAFGRHYVAAAAVHDAGTYSCVLGVAPARPELHLLRSADAFDQALSRIPGFARLVDPEAAAPLHGVQVMGGLRNTMRVPRTVATRVIALGDALATTDPSRGRGTALAAVQAAHLSALLREGVPSREVAGRYYAEVLDPLREWVLDARASSTWRERCWGSGDEPRPLRRAPAVRSAWEWLQTPALDEDEQRIRSAYSQTSARPSAVVAAGMSRGDAGRADPPGCRLESIESLVPRPAGACPA